MSYAEDRIIDELNRLAVGNPKRLAILEARRGRRSSRSRTLHCSACGDSHGYEVRGKDDVCAWCLRDMWQGADAVAKANAMMMGRGLITVRMATPGQAHDMPYPALTTSYDAVPHGAVFDVGGGDSNRTMQKLFTELFASWAEFYPAPEESRQGAKSVIGGGSTLHYNGGNAAFMPARTAELLEALWCFIIWHSQTANLEGFKKGTDLLTRLNDGLLPEATFIQEIASRTQTLTERAIEAAAGKVGNRP
jgi:hypothetical protein